MDADGEGLLAEDVPAGFEGALGLLVVDGVGARRCGPSRLRSRLRRSSRRVVDLGDAEAIGGAAAGLGVDFEDADDGDADAAQGFGMDGADEAAADEGDLGRICENERSTHRGES